MILTKSIKIKFKKIVHKSKLPQNKHIKSKKSIVFIYYLSFFLPEKNTNVNLLVLPFEEIRLSTEGGLLSVTEDGRMTEKEGILVVKCSD